MRTEQGSRPDRPGSFTVITYYTPDFAEFLGGLQEDCGRLGYPLQAHACPQNFDNVIQAFDYKIDFIRDAIREFDRVLWLDVECRIDQPVPDDWQSPLISCYSSGTSQGLSSGILMLDTEQLWLVDLWSRYARKYPDYPDDFVLDFLANQIGLAFRTVPFEFYDRDTTCRISRGEWRNSHTVIRHPTTNRWRQPLRYRRAFNGSWREQRTAEEVIARQRKAIFFRNFAGQFSVVDRVMRAGLESQFHYADWVFDAREQTFAPEMFWPEYQSDYSARPRTFAQSWERFLKPPPRRSFREQALRKMRLTRQDRRKFHSAGRDSDS